MGRQIFSPTASAGPPPSAEHLPDVGAPRETFPSPAAGGPAERGPAERGPAELAKAPEPPVFDRHRTLFRCGNDPMFACEIIDLFIVTARELTAGLPDAVAAADADRVCRLAHRLKGAATNVSGRHVEALAQQLVEVGRAGELDRARPLLADLAGEIDRLEHALTQFRWELSPQGETRCAS